MPNKISIFLLLLVMLVLMSSPAFAMSVDFIQDYQTYKPVGFVYYSGIQIDQSTAGVTFDLGNPSSVNSTTLNLNSPDGTTSEWYVWVRMTGSGLSTMEIVQNPPDISLYLVCVDNGGVGGGTFNITSFYPNYTWNTGYAVFRLSTTATPIYYAYTPLTGTHGSPIGRDLTTVHTNCGFAVNPDDWGNSTQWVRVSVWNVNPSREQLCNVDPAVQSIQESTLGIIDINYQVWVIFFDVFQIVVMLVALFGIPILLIRMVRWIVDEVKKSVGGKKVF